MDDFKRMAAVLLVLILIIANLAVAVVSEFDFSEYTDSGNQTGYPAGREPQKLSLDAGEVTEKPQETQKASDTGTGAEVTQPVSEEVPEDNRKETEPVHNLIPTESFSGEPDAMSQVTVEGVLEAVADKKIFQVTLPVGSTVIEYIADPQGLICQSESVRYPDSFFDPDSNVYFSHGKVKSADGKKLDYWSGESEPFTVVNKSSCAVSVVARISASYRGEKERKVFLSDTDEWNGNFRPAVFIAARRSDSGDEIPVSLIEQVIEASVPGCPGAYRCIYEGDGRYRYELMNDSELEAFRKSPAAKDLNTEFSEFSLTLRGDCNGEGEWDTDTEYEFPTVSIVWNVGFAPSARPYVSQKNVSVASDREINIPFSFGVNDARAYGIISAEYITPENEARQLRWNDYYMQFSDTEIKFTPEFCEYSRERGGGTVKFRFDDPLDTVCTVTLDRDSAPYLEENGCTVSQNDAKQIAISYNPGSGDKAAGGISKISYGNSDLSAYSSVNDGRIVLSASAVRTIQNKNGGSVYITFDDPAHTKCSFKINVEK